MAFELLEKYHRLIWNCQSCSTCQRGPQNPFAPTGATPDRICPSYDKYRRLTYSAQGRLLAAKALLTGDLEPTEELVESLFECTLCGACGPERMGRSGCCMHRSQVDIFRDFRADLVNSGYGPTEPYKKTAASIEKSGNRFGAKSNRAKWAEGLDLPDQADLLFFVGCVASFRKMEIAQATAKLLQTSGTKFTILGQEEWCCGNPLINSGLKDQFAKVVAHNVEAIKKTGAKKVVTSCACCYSILKHRYPEVDANIDFEVLHSSQVIAELIEAGKLKPVKPVSGKLTYQDPCNLTRVGVPEGTLVKEPRDIINSIPNVEFSEMDGTGMYTQCCGRNPYELPELSANAAANRIEDARAAGADTIVTSCSFCDWSLSKALKDMDNGITSLDITVLLEQSLG